MNKEPLTIQELREMAGKPVYCPELGLYGIIKYEIKGCWAGMLFFVGVYHNDGCAVSVEYDIMERQLKCYRVI